MVVDHRVHAVEPDPGSFLHPSAAHGKAVSFPAATVGDAADLLDVHMDQTSDPLGSETTHPPVSALARNPKLFGDMSDRPPIGDHALNEQPTTIQIQTSVNYDPRTARSMPSRMRSSPNSNSFP